MPCPFTMIVSSDIAGTYVAERQRRAEGAPLLFPEHGSNLIIEFDFGADPAIFDDADLVGQRRQPGGHPVVDGPGATGQVVALADYMAFLREHGALFDRYLALDVVGEPEATDRNLHAMLDAGLRPIPVHVRGDTL